MKSLHKSPCQEIAAFTSQVTDAFKSAGYKVDCVSNAVDSLNFANSTAFTAALRVLLRLGLFCWVRAAAFWWLG